MRTKTCLPLLIAAVISLASSSVRTVTAAIQSSYETAYQAYLYAYPMVLMEVTRLKGSTPSNTFAHARALSDPSERNVVRPNVDTLYSVAWLDLSGGPVLLTVPDTQGRYYVLQMMDMWSDVFATPGARATGTEAKQFVVQGPADASNGLPADPGTRFTTWFFNSTPKPNVIVSPTNQVWIVGRTQTNGAADYDAVHQIQNGYQLTPIKVRQSTAVMGCSPALCNPSLTPPEIVAQMDAATFFETFAQLMKNNPPHGQDWPMVELMRQIGIIPGGTFYFYRQEPATRTALTQAASDAQRMISSGFQSTGSIVNGWSITKMFNGNYGTSYSYRANVARFGLGANLPEDAIYPITTVDAQGHPLDGNSRYVIHFAAGQTPPVNAFWSVTLYDAEGYLVVNPINRYKIGGSDALVKNDDGSIDLYIQNQAPSAEKQANWLPAPEGVFNLTMRLYWPTNDVLYGSTWQIPPVKPVSP